MHSLSRSMLIAGTMLVLLPGVDQRCGVAQQPGGPQDAKVTRPLLPLALKSDSTPLYPKLKEAFLLGRSGKVDEAAAGYRAALESAIATQDRPAQALAHDGLSAMLYSKADYPAAKIEGEQALSLYRLLQEPVSEALVTQMLGNVAYQMGDRALAREYYQKALTSFDSLHMLREKAAMLRNLDMADDPDGEKLLEQSLAIAREIGDKDLQAAILQNQGDRLFGRGELDAAQDRYGRAEQLLRETGNQQNLSYLLTSEGRLQRAHGHPEKAIPLYQEGLEIQEKIGDRRGQIQNTNAIAKAYHHLGDYHNSTRFIEKALALARETGSPYLIGFELLGLADEYMALGRNQEAVDILKDSIEKDPDAAYADYGYSNLGTAYLRLGRLRESLESQSKAIQIAQAHKNWDLLPSALLSRAEAEERLGSQTEALSDAEEALRVIEDVRKHLVPNDFMKRGFADSTQETYRLYVRLLEHSGQPGRALEVAEEARARAFLDLLATRDLQLKADNQVRLASLRKPEEHIPEGGLNGAKANAPPGSPAGILMRGGRSSDAHADSSSDPELRSLVSVQAFSLPDVQATAGRLNSTILSYWVTPDATYIWVVPPSGAVHTSVVDVTQKHLEELIGGLGPSTMAESGGTHPGRTMSPSPSPLEEKQRSQSSHKVGTRGGTILTIGTSHGKKWRELYSLLIGPVEGWLPSKPESLLTIEPHGPLLMLPFAALMDKQGRYLLERFSLHYTPAVSLLQFTQKKEQEVERTPPHYLLVADPSNMPRGPGENTLPGLPGSRHEVATVARLLPGSEVTLLEGKQATEDQVANAAGQNTVIHFATHGIIRDDQPFESFLALGRSATEKDRDGRLTAQKIYSLDLHADLVFLSACRSGAGKVSGDGLVGLTRAFWYAGTPSVIASLWDVADEPTYRLVASFYRSRLQGKDKSRALRSAQLHLLHDLRAGRVTVHTPTSQIALPEDPVFWASFVLQGEP